jgi:hypothetical protein
MIDCYEGWDSASGRSYSSYRREVNELLEARLEALELWRTVSVQRKRVR